MAQPITAHIPPQNLEAEESVLGAMMVAEGSIAPVILDVRLHAEDFYRDRHRTIFGAIRALYERSEPIDALTVSEFLAQRGELEDAGGKDQVATLASTTPAPGNARHYARIVKQNALLRRLLGAAQTIQQSVHERGGEPESLVEDAERLLFRVAHEDRASEFRKIAEVLGEEIDRLEALAKGEREVTGTPSGFRDLDDILGGFQPGNLIVIAARPSLGKSALVCNFAEKITTKYKRPVAFFSLEMSEAELAHRFISSSARISNDRLRKGKVSEKDWPGVVRACNELEKAPLWLDDSSDLSLLEVRAKARRLTASEGELGLVIVDYMQLMRPEDPRANRVEQVGQVSRGLKILARELNVPVIGVSQLSRAPELRTGRDRGRPMLSDLRESGCLVGESRVFLADEGTYVPIADLVGAKGFRVLAVNPENWKLEPRRVTRAFSTGRKPVLRLRTRLGRELRATGNHKFLTLDGWRRLDELEAGIKVALPRKLDGPSRGSMRPVELALLGHLIGDGCTLPRHAIQYTTNDATLASLVAELARRLFGEGVAPRIKKERDRKRQREWFQVYLPATERLSRARRNPIAKWLSELEVFGLQSHEKRVPEAVFAQDDEGVALFLRHLWATDGCVTFVRTPRGLDPRVYYATSSRRLANDVQSLLLRMGITARQVATMGSPGRPQYHVKVTGGEDLRRFLVWVGAVGQAKEKAAAGVLDWLGERRTNTNRDVIPKEAWNSLVQPAMASTGVTTRQFQAQLGISYRGSTIYKSAMSRERAARVADAVDSGELARLAESDVYWDAIESIEQDGMEEVYDLTVEGLHNFVADDVIVHNSIEQDADVVMFIYRESKYHEDADPSEAEFIVAKHRNGPTGDVPAVFLEKYPKFADRAPGERPVEQKAGEGPPLIDLAEEA